MPSAYLGKILVDLLELPFLKCNENTVFLFKNTYNNNRVPFCLKVIFFVIFGGWPYFLNKTLDKSYSKQLRMYDLAN